MLAELWGCNARYTPAKKVKKKVEYVKKGEQT